MTVFVRKHLGDCPHRIQLLLLQEEHQRLRKAATRVCKYVNRLYPADSLFLRQLKRALDEAKGKEKQ